MRRNQLVCFILFLYLTACQTRSTFIPGFTFGASEKEWRKQLTSEVTKVTLRVSKASSDTTYLYDWKLDDTTITVEIAPNADRLETGPLRKMSLYFYSDVKETKEDSRFATLLIKAGKDLANLDCAYRSTMEYLTRQYGQPDSFSVYNAKDTSYWYLKKDYSIELSSSNMGLNKEPRAGVHIYALSYKEDYESAMKAKQATLRPADVVEVRFKIAEITEVKNEYGYTNPVLHIISDKEEALSVAEKRTIEAIKGTLTIKDRFGEILYSMPDLEYTPDGGLEPSAMTFLFKGKGWTITLYDAPDLDLLRKAVVQENQLEVVFNPTAVYYTDGTVLK